ncbi:MAG TPA: PPE family protein [Mycobacterium sp.]|nr:PPE family protein [Mycobacterium sp.]
MFGDFGARPPEVNAGLVYGGDGSATMLAASAAWDGLAANLVSTSASYKSLIARLATEEWLGPSSAAMVVRVTPQLVWMDTAAGQAEQTAVQARAAAAAFDAAFAMTVPPPVILANRAQLQALVASNVLGVNTAAIMATEAVYMGMWAQCAAALYGYAAAASVAAQLPPFGSPAPKTANAMLGADDTGTQSGNSLGSTGSVLDQLLDSLATAGPLGDPGGAGMGPNANIWNTITSTGMVNPALFTSMIADLAVVSGFSDVPVGSSYGIGGPGIGSVLGTAHLMSGTAPASATLTSGAPVGAGSAAVSAGLGRAAPVGMLSVPPSWGAAAPTGPTASVLPGHSPVAGHAGGPGAPGVPLAGMARGGSVTGPRYGIRPTVMARPPAAGYAPDVL